MPDNREKETEVRDLAKRFQTRISPIGILILSVALILFAVIFGRLISNEPFGYDEADYMYAASKGFWASYLDRPSLSLIKFVETGITSGLHSDERRKLSQFIRQSDDITLYRHFHAPLYFYWLGFIQSVWGAKESIVRSISLLSLMLTTVIVYFGSLALAGKQGRFIGLFAVAFLLLSPTNIEGAQAALPHSLYSAFAMGTLFLLAKLVQANNLRFLYGALVFLALAFLTIEYAPLLLIVLLVTVFVHRRDLFPNWSRSDLVRFSLKCVAVPLLVIGALWPAGLYKLSLVKTYIFFAYIASVRNQDYGTKPLIHVWWTRIISSPLEYSLLLSLSGYLLYLLFRRRDLRYLLPFFLYAVLMFLTTARNHSEAALHVLSLICCLGVTSAFAVSLVVEAQPKLRGVIATVVLLGLAINNFWFYYRIESSRPADRELSAVVKILQESGVRGQRLLVPAHCVPTIHYYFRETNLSSYTEGNGAEILDKLMSGNFDGILYEASNFEGLWRLRQKNWAIRNLVKVESATPGRAVAYYLLPTRSGRN